MRGQGDDVGFMPTRPYWIMPARELQRVACEAAEHEAVAADESLPWARRQNARARAVQLRRRLRADADGGEMTRHGVDRSAVRHTTAPARQEYMPTKPATRLVAAATANADLQKLRALGAVDGESFSSRWARMFEGVRNEPALRA